jgi:phage-related tail fiber protein
MPITINGSGTINGVTELNNAIPPGSVIHVCTTSAPAGWLKANGAAISRTAYANLFAAIGTTFGTGDGSTTFTLPDLRGLFVRGWQDGAGYDAGRVFGSYQDHLFASHGHGVNDPGHNHEIVAQTGPGGVNYNGNYAAGLEAIAGPVQWWSSAAGTGISIQNNGGTETRPRNIALLACIKF